MLKYKKILEVKKVVKEFAQPAQLYNCTINNNKDNIIY